MGEPPASGVRVQVPTYFEETLEELPLLLELPLSLSSLLLPHATRRVREQSRAKKGSRRLNVMESVPFCLGWGLGGLDPPDGWRVRDGAFLRKRKSARVELFSGNPPRAAGA